MSAINYVGLAYGCIWIFIFGYTFRLTSMSKRLADKLDELERGAQYQGER